jgi:hypothetical protein
MVTIAAGARSAAMSISDTGGSYRAHAGHLGGCGGIGVEPLEQRHTGRDAAEIVPNSGTGAGIVSLPQR